MSEKNASTFGLAVLAVFVLIVGTVLFFGVATVDEGDRGVEKTQSAVTGDIYEPGWNFVIPFYQSVEHIEVRPQTYTMSGDIHDGEVDQEDAINFRSSDQQQIGADITVRYSINEDEVDQFHSQYNTIPQFEERLLRPETIDTVAREGSAFDATEANSDEGRQEIAEVVQNSLTEESPNYVEIESVQVRDIHLDPEFRAALEDVEIAAQEAEAERTRAEGDADAEIIRAEGDAEAEITRAEGQSEAFETILEAYGDEETALQAEWIEAINQDEGTIVIDAEAAPMLDIDTDNSSASNGNE